MTTTPAFLECPDQNFNLIALNDFHALGEDRHARIESKPEGFLLRDLRSGQPTFLNGARINEAWLSEGDQIQVGTQTFIFTHEGPKENSDLGLKTRSPDWARFLQKMGRVADSDFSILLLGPSGTGKDVIAEKIHQNSKRRKGPFVSVNCSALSETLIESELFGHLKGSFTGAIADRKGAFEAARGGTLFLDEIGDLPYGLQAKLLRALENGEIRPVGSDKNVKTDVRVLAATHQNLTGLIDNGDFRADLYFRLNVVTVSLPCLADRMEDFEDLLYSFAKALRVRFSHSAIQRLKKHSWPGNIRELRNVVSRASAFYPRELITENEIDQLLDGAVRSTRRPLARVTPELPVMKEIEKQMITKRLQANQGNQRRTAIDLGIPKSTLHDRIKVYNIDVRQFQVPTLPMASEQLLQEFVAPAPIRSEDTLPVGEFLPTAYSTSQPTTLPASK